MKKILAFILTGVMAFSITACGQGKAEESTSSAGSGPASAEESSSSEDSAQASEAESAVTEESSSAADSAQASEAESSSAEQSAKTPIVGGWSRPDSPAVTQEITDLIEKATEGLVGAQYVPVAYLASQIVNGTNYAILCTITPVVPDAVPAYAVVTVYEDLEGNAEITGIQDSEIGPEKGGPLGGWSAPETPDVTDEAKEALDNAAEKMLGAEYEAIALLARQIVNGTNYSLLCEITAVSPGAEPKYAVVNVYADLQGNAEITEIFEFKAE